MGYYAHHALLVFVGEEAMQDQFAARYAEHGYRMPDVDAFREALPEKFRSLLIGPVRVIANGGYTVALLPDGSKEDWSTSNMGDDIRQQLADLFSWKYPDGGSPFQVIEVRWGGMDPEVSYAVDPLVTEFVDHDEYGRIPEGMA
jgi:hypothetical protein